MSRTIQTLLLGLAVLAAALMGRETRAQAKPACADISSPEGPSMVAQSAIATPQQPARIVPGDGPRLISKSPALRLTLRPTALDPDVPFLAQVFARDVCGGDGPGQLLGVVSFLPAKIGQSQEFVLPAPELGFPSVARQNIQITIKLIPANSARELDRASLEVVKAGFAE
jgi:hypothetical protein